MTPKQQAWTLALETEASFFAELARTCESVGEPALARAAERHAKALAYRAVLAAEESEPKPAKPKATKPRTVRKRGGK